jgi:hypothetical protein
MNWDMIGAIGEILGAAGVILTLGYLARQVRTSHRLERRQSGEAAMDRISNFLARISADSQLARIWFHGTRETGDLSTEEKVQFGALCLDLTYIWERIYYLDVDGSIDAGLVATMQRGRSEIACSPGYRRWFELRKEWISDDFRREIERDQATGGQVYRPLGIGPELSDSTSGEGA